MRNTTLCYIRRGGDTLLLHRVKKENDENRDNEVRDCDEGVLEWLPWERLPQLPIWEGDRIFLRLIDEDAPFFSLKLRYTGDRLVEAVLNGKQLEVRSEE